MNLNLFQLISLFIALSVAFYICFKYKISFISNFIIGGLILILLSKFDILYFEGKLDTLTFVIVTFGFILINISSFFLSFFKEEKTFFFILPTIVYLLITIILMFTIDPSKYLIFKLGILLRLFISYYPLHILLYYKKY